MLDMALKMAVWKDPTQENTELAEGGDTSVAEALGYMSTVRSIRKKPSAN